MTIDDIPHVPARRGAHFAEPDVVPSWAFWAAGYVLLVIAMEFAGSLWGDSPSARYPGFLSPIAWPTPLRVVVWLGAAAASVVHQVGLRQAGAPRKPVIAGLTTLMFLVFAFGIATDQQWSTWH